MTCFPGAVNAAGLADFFDTNSGTTYASAVAGSVVKEIVDNIEGGAGGGATAQEVWEYATRTLTSYGPIEHTQVPKARILSVRSRGDGTFGVVGRVRMKAGETLWWAVDLKGTQLAAGDLIDSMSAPSITGAQSANLTTPDYGIFGTLAKFQCVMSASALTTDTINIVLTIAPESGETFKVTVPVTVGS